MPFVVGCPDFVLTMFLKLALKFDSLVWWFKADTEKPLCELLWCRNWDYDVSMFSWELVLLIMPCWLACRVFIMFWVWEDLIDTISMHSLSSGSGPLTCWKLQFCRFYSMSSWSWFLLTRSYFCWTVAICCSCKEASSWCWYRCFTMLSVSMSFPDSWNLIGMSSSVFIFGRMDGAYLSMAIRGALPCFWSFFFWFDSESANSSTGVRSRIGSKHSSGSSVRFGELEFNLTTWFFISPAVIIFVIWMSSWDCETFEWLRGAPWSACWSVVSCGSATACSSTSFCPEAVFCSSPAVGSTSWVSETRLTAVCGCFLT